MSYGSDYLREALALNERKVNNKKRLIEKINHENDEINDLLRKAADTSYKLTDDEKRILKDNGYTITYGGGSGKDGGVVTSDGKSGTRRSNIPIDDKVDWHNKFKVNSERNNISPSYKSTNKSSGREKLPQRYTQQAYDMSKDVKDFKSAKSQFIDYDTQVQTEKNRLRKAKLGASSNEKDYYKDNLNYAISGRDKSKKRKDAILNKHGVQARESIEESVGNDFIIEFTHWIYDTPDKPYYVKGLYEDEIVDLTPNLNEAKGFNSFDEADEFAIEYGIASPSIYPRKDANKHNVQARESIKDKQPLKEGFMDELYSDIQYELHYSIKDALDNILVNLIDNINREFPEYNLNRIDTEQYSEEMSEIIMKDLFSNM